ncbi:nicotinate phosphoribosyltransferase [Plasmodium gonderi]|uniref:nicotinate phosphoribosyltransferase n=1 Tax=Plasmodium gonderi TaxID=77519 RepID=A0A1Y1JHN1_PLAGO|nr:nicotinate phosphoribosyltransferase [Plasmodium gonderi]GAW81740.1 nicotinate phosphoribosyltransferase [Plasmodium gonderi]
MCNEHFSNKDGISVANQQPNLNRKADGTIPNNYGLEGCSNSSIMDNIRVDKNNNSLYIYDVRITEDDLRQLLTLKKKEVDDNVTKGISLDVSGKVQSIEIQKRKKEFSNLSANGACSNELHYEQGGICPAENLKMVSLVNCTKYIIENRINKDIDIPHSNTVNALFMDYYHLVMAYTFFRQKKHENESTFEIYFRNCPFNGRFAILGGVYEAIKYINSFRFTEAQLEFIKKKMSHYQDIDLFINYLKGLSGKNISIYSMEEGDVVFPHEPLMVVQGPLLMCQILESALLNLLNYPTLIATNSMLYKISINYKTLAEFGCRRAQGPDGALSGTRYSAVGCDFTSNVYASFLYDIPIIGTMSHSFISSYKHGESVYSKYLDNYDFLSIVNKNKEIIHKLYNCEFANDSELTAFVAFAQINPKIFICLIDTYDSLKSGIYNFLIVALSLLEINYKPIGIRIDSGDLLYLTNECKKIFNDVSEKLNVPFKDLKICISNDINEQVIKKLHEQEHHIDIFAIGTNLITCQSQPSLGLVYKLVEINNHPCFKLTNENKKSNLPYRKRVYRLYTDHNFALHDYIQYFDETPPTENQKITCVNVLDGNKESSVIPKKVEEKLHLIWDHGKLLTQLKTVSELKQYTYDEITKFKKEHFSTTHPTSYDVLFSSNYHELYKNLLVKNSFYSTPL